jgi:hypothetical protein
MRWSPHFPDRRVGILVVLLLGIGAWLWSHRPPDEPSEPTNGKERGGPDVPAASGKASATLNGSGGDPRKPRDPENGGPAGGVAPADPRVEQEALSRHHAAGRAAKALVERAKDRSGDTTARTEALARVAAGLNSLDPRALLVSLIAVPNLVDSLEDKIAARRAVERQLASDDLAVRLQAVVALSHLGVEAGAVKAWVRATAGLRSWPRDELAEALVRGLGGEVAGAAADRVSEWLRSPDRTVVLAVVWALRMARGLAPSVEARLLELAASSDPKASYLTLDGVLRSARKTRTSLAALVHLASGKGPAATGAVKALQYGVAEEDRADVVRLALAWVRERGSEPAKRLAAVRVLEEYAYEADFPRIESLAAETLEPVLKDALAVAAIRVRDKYVRERAMR